jgi:mRNA interferase YafQ
MATDGGVTPRALVTTKSFERDLKRLRKRGKDIDRLWDVVEALRLGQPLRPRHRDHPLSGDWQGFRDCHVEPDWVLIYQLDDEAVYLTRTGTHADLFE